jgi:hypothetical protein
MRFPWRSTASPLIFGDIDSMMYTAEAALTAAAPLAAFACPTEAGGARRARSKAGTEDVADVAMDEVAGLVVVAKAEAGSNDAMPKASHPGGKVRSGPATSAIMPAGAFRAVDVRLIAGTTSWADHSTLPSSRSSPRAESSVLYRPGAVRSACCGSASVFTPTT